MCRISAVALGLALLAFIPQAVAQQAPARVKDGPGGTFIPSNPVADAPWLSLEQLRAKYGGPKGRIADIGGVEVFYKDEGQGPAILLIHGSVSSLKTYDSLAASLAKNYRVIRFDIPPQGLSGPVSDDALAKLKPTDIPEQLLARLHIKKVTIVGVSSGGTMAVQLAAKRPDLVDRLIISNAPADQVRTGHQTLTPALIAAIDEYKRLGYQSRNYWEAFLDFYAGVPSRYDAKFREQIYDMNRRAPRTNIVGLVAVVEDHEKAVAAMNAVKVPVLLIWGGADPLLPYSAMEAMAGYLKNAEVSKIKLPDVGHYPPVEIPQRYAQMVRAYIEAAVPDDAEAKR
jgi:pimeloyl-ACP methyl ester carboxylesterase